MSLPEPLAVAKAVLIHAIERLRYMSECDFCRAGQAEDDGSDALHEDECPLYKFDDTADVERLLAWAKEP